MEYKVVLTSASKIQFGAILNYLLYELESQEAATNIVNDFDDTLSRLSHVAGSLKLCDDRILRAKGYRTIHFKKHQYFMVYTIDQGTAYIEGIYHDLQDYENTLR